MQTLADLINDAFRNLRAMQFVAFSEITLYGGLSMETYTVLQQMIAALENQAETMQPGGFRVAGTFANRLSPEQAVRRQIEVAREQLAELDEYLVIDVQAACASVERAGSCDAAIVSDLERWYLAMK